MLAHKRQFFSLLLISLIVFTCGVVFYLASSNSLVQHGNTNQSNIARVKEYAARDFQRYQCNDMRRIGGLPKFVWSATDNLSRIDGAWYVCFDGRLRPEANKCIVLSFGIRDDPSFDRAMNGDHGCRVESFDPFYEDAIFTGVRKTQGAHSLTLSMNEKWRFHRVGISGVASQAFSSGGVGSLKIKDLLSFEQVLEFIALRGQVIDVFKMDVEGAERSVLERMDMDYMCAHVKQFLLETHIMIRFVAVPLLMKLEKCFYLFQRNTRFFFEVLKDENGAAITEFESQKGYMLPLKRFKDEIQLVNYALTMGELYFVNLNFL